MSDNFDKSAILESFLDEVHAYMPDIEANLDRLQQSPDDTEALEETYRLTHTIGGSAAMMEFSALSKVAQGMEEILGDTLDRHASLEGPTLALLRRSYTRLTRLVEHVRTGEDDTPILEDDERDRGTWRGDGAPGSGTLNLISGMLGSNGSSPANGFGGSDGMASSGAHAGAESGPAQLPEWLAAFADPNLAQGGGASSAPPTPGPASWSTSGVAQSPAASHPFAASSAGMPGAQSTPGVWQQSAPQGPAPSASTDRWASSVADMPTTTGPSIFDMPTGAVPAISDMPTGANPAISPQRTERDAFASSSASTNQLASQEVQGTWSWSGSHAASSPQGMAPGTTPATSAPNQGGTADPFGASGFSSAFGPDATRPRWEQETRPRPQGADPLGWAQSQPAATPYGTGGTGAGQPADPPAWGASSANGWGAAPASADPAQPFGVSTPQAPHLAPIDGARSYPAPTVPYARSQPSPSSQTHGLPLSAVDTLRVDEEALRRQVGALRDVVAELREAAQTMEDERTELRTFLDGSKDALERLEDWAGMQMGLDLRRSPESVRRYLPLSVVWVMTTRLKKLVALLHNSGRSLTAHEEQIEEVLGELRSSIAGLGNIQSTVSSFGGAADNGFSATVAQITWAPPPTVESQPASRDLSTGERVELERAVREELRRELEDEVRDELAAEIRRDETERLRHELEIQVRRHVLAELAPGLGTPTALGEPGLLPQMPFAERGPRQTQVTSEQSPEALEVFREEALEHLQTITTGIADLESQPGNVDALRSIRRAMHTLKGAAGMMGFTVIQGLAHASEDLLEALTDGQINFNSEVLSLILDTSEALDALVTGTLAPDEQHQLANDLITRYASVPGMPDTERLVAATQSEQPSTAVVIADDADDAVPQPSPATRNSADLSVRLQLSKLDDLVNLFGELLINRSVLEERVDRLNHLIGDSVRVGERLRDVGGQLESRFEAATLPSGRPTSVNLLDGNAAGAAWNNMGRMNGFGAPRPDPAHAKEFDELELDRYTEFHRLSRGLSEGVADSVTLSHEMETLVREIQTSFARENRLSSDFQDRLLKARLVPLQSLVPRLYRAARASALKEGKEVEFFVEGTETEVDRKVFEEVEGPLLHLVRNAVNHGLERPDARELAGKPRTGKIVVSAAYEGNQVVISVRDDGAGIDPERIRATAIARGWIDGYTPMTEKDAIELIFRAGVSTADSLTEESGRGVGLDVVRDVVTRLRGTVEVDSQPGEGTLFTLKFPISLQIARAVLVHVGTQTLAIPMAVVEQIGRLDYYSRVPGNTPSIEVRGERYPLVHLAGYLRMTPNPVDERSPVLLVNAGRHRVALLVDDVVSQQEVVSKPLGTHLRDVRGVAGASVLGNGQVVLILELHELLSQPPRGSVTLPPPGGQKPQSVSPTTASHLPTGPMPVVRGEPSGSLSAIRTAPQPVISGSRGFVVSPRTSTAGPSPDASFIPGAQQSYLLVVDDSPSVRRVVSNMLKAHGWTVQTARDGVEALEVVARERPAAILLDIEMPRMDGYELMATIRSQEQYRTLPLIVLTSRAAAKHQQRATQLGADAYIVKPYQDDELLQTIARLIQARSA